MNKKITITILIIVFLILVGGFYFRNIIFKNINNNFQSFQKTDIGNIITQVGKEAFTPPPLNIGGENNQVILTKAKIIAQTNIQRYNQGTGLLPLFENEKLNVAAQAKANDMFKNQYFEHVSPSGIDPGKLVQSFGYDYITTGENLILGNFGSEKELVQAWMNSPGHRANILNDRYTEIGVAIIKGTYKGSSVWIGVQEFGLPMSACTQPSVGLKNKIDSYQNQLDSLSLAIDKKISEINTTDRHSQEYNTLVDQYNELVKQYQSLANDSKGFIAQYNSEVNIFNQCVAGK